MKKEIHYSFKSKQGELHPGIELMKIVIDEEKADLKKWADDHSEEQWYKDYVKSHETLVSIYNQLEKIRYYKDWCNLENEIKKVKKSNPDLDMIELHIYCGESGEKLFIKNIQLKQTKP